MVYLVNPAAVVQLNFGLTLAIVLPLQLTTLWTTGLYREKMNQLSIANVLHTTASIATAVGLTGIVFLLMEFLSPIGAAQFLIFDFYFLLTLLFGYRVAYQALSFGSTEIRKPGRMF